MREAREVMLWARCCGEVVKRKLCGHDGAYCRNCTKDVDAILTALSSAGLAVVPVEPSDVQLVAAINVPMRQYDHEVRCKRIYKAMIAALPPLASGGG